MAAETLGLEQHHLPICDVDVPEARFRVLWTYSAHRLRAHLLARRRVLLHCCGGLGWTGTIAVRLLAKLGMVSKAALAAVRRAWPDTVETAA